MKKIRMTILSLISVGFAVTAGCNNVPSKTKYEKCFGIAKAFKNDCGAKNQHSCEGSSTQARDPYNFLIIPKGLCNKIVGGSTHPPVHKKH